MAPGIRPGRRSDSAGVERTARPRYRAADDVARRASRVRRHEVIREAQGRGVKVGQTLAHLLGV